MTESPRKVRPWRRFSGAVAALLVVAAATILIDHQPVPAGLNVSRRGPAQLYDGGTNDSVMVFWKRFYPDNNSSYTVYEESFSATAIAGRRYIIDIINGNGSGSNPASSAIVDVNGQQFVGSSELGTGVPALKRIADGIIASNSLIVQAKGVSGSYFDLRIVHVPDSTYKVHGDTSFTKPSPAATQYGSFPGDSINAGTPYMLRIINGNGNGTNRVGNATFKLNGTTILSGGDFGTGVATITRGVTLLDTMNHYEIVNSGATGSKIKVQFRAQDKTAPVLVVTQPASDTTYTKANSVSVAGSVTDQTAGTVTVNGSGATATPGSFSMSVSLPSDGWHTVTVSATNSAGLTTTMVHKVARDNAPPAVDLKLSISADSTTDSLITLGIKWRDTTRTVVTCDGSSVGIARYDSVVVNNHPLDIGPNRIFVRAVDALNETTTVTRIVLRKPDSDSPPSAPTASVLPTTEITPFRESIAFLFTGGSAVQTGGTLKPDSIKALLASVVRGKVVARDWGPVANVLVRVLGHPEYGETKTRADGQFDLAVNGGRPVVLRFSKLGFLEAQRRVEPAINVYMTLDDVALIGRSARVTSVDLENPTVFKSRFATDANGDREVRLYFPGSLRAWIGSPESEYRYVKVRATEYTQGAQGGEAMPAQLPPSSAYTYCVELTLDEADAVANTTGEPTSVRFTKPVSCYVQNFLAYPVGTRVPFGSFDRKTGLWKAEDDALILKVVSAAHDTALVDLTGDGVADTSSALLDSLGLSVPERKMLLAEYSVNAVLCRALLNHFTPGDLNPNAGPPPDELPRGPGRIFKLLGNILGPCLFGGSIIECENRILGERLPVVGTPYTLNYRSFRASGDSAVRTVRIPIIRDSIPPTLNRVYVQLEAAGKVYKREILRPQLSPDQIVPITWDGYDVYGRRVEGSINAVVSVGYRYDAFAMSSRTGGRGFGNSARNAGVLTVSGDRSVPRVNWIRRPVVLGTPSTGSDGLGGWTISPHHVFDPNGRGAIYYGSGEFDSGDRVPMSRFQYSNFGAANNNIDNTPIANVLLSVTALTVDVDGTLYLADSQRGSIYRVGKDRILHRVAGNGASAGSFSATYEGGPATSAVLSGISDLAIGPDGTLYFVAAWPGGTNNLVCKITSDGTLRRVIGDNVFFSYGGPFGTGGDNAYIGSAKVYEVNAIAFGPDGSLFLAESGPVASGGNYSRVRRVGADSTISTYAGGPCRASSDSTGPASSLCLGDASDIGVDAQGNLYILEGPHSRLRKVTPEGRLSTVAYRFNSHFVPAALALAPDGSVYLANGQGVIPNQAQGVYRVDPDSTLSYIAGNATGTFVNGAPVTTAPLTDVTEIAALPDGSYFVVSHFAIFLITQRFATDLGDEWMVPNEAGTEMYFFNKKGRHLRTRDALTGTLRHWFTYDATHGDLTAIHDADGGTTTIIRNSGTRAPQKIQGPDGQETDLSLVADQLTRVTDPGGNVTSMAYSSGGLLDSLTDGNNHRTSFTWESDGRLRRDTDAAGGYQELTPDSLMSRLRVVLRKSRLNRETRYRVAPRDDGTMLRQVKDAVGNVVNTDYKLDTSVETTLPDGTVRQDSIAADKRFYLASPVLAGTRIRLPSGLARTVQVTRTYDISTFNPPALATSAWIEQTFVNGASRESVVVDVANHRVVLQHFLNRKTTVTVDTAGRPIASYTPGLDTLRRDYDARGRIIALRQGGRGWRMIYDMQGRVSTVWDTLGLSTIFSYDDANRVTEQALPGGRTIQFGYDAVGNLKSVTPPGRTAHKLDFSPVNLVSRYHPPGVGLPDSLTEYMFNYDRQLTNVLRPGAANIALGYNSSTGRLENVSTARGDIEFGYDAVGRLNTIESPDGVRLTYNYDGVMRTEEEWDGVVNGTVGTTLDNEFRMATQSVNAGPPVAFSYDRDGLLTIAGALSIDRSDDNGLVQGTALDGSDIVTSETHNAFGEPELSVARDGSDTLLSSLYSRDPVGRIVAIRENVLGAVSLKEFAYSDTGFLTRVTVNNAVVGRYRYDQSGNRLRFEGPGLAVDGIYDGQDRLTRYGSTRYTYAAAGERLETIDSTGTGFSTTRLGYDPLGNLLKVWLASGDSIEYVIDGRGRRVARKLNGVVRQQWLYQDQIKPVAELDGGGNLVARYVYGSRMNVPDYVVKSDTVFRIISDNLGSVRLVVHASDRTVRQQMDYDAYGQVILDTNPGFQCFGFAGGLLDSATTLVRIGARDYDPMVGQWTTRDPSGLLGCEFNQYVYAAASPVSFLDVDGLATVNASIGVSGTAALAPSLANIFVGGGVAVGVNSNGQVYVQAQANASVGAGAYWGVGAQGSAGVASAPLPAGVSVERTGHAEANVGWGPGSVGGSVDANFGSASVSGPIPKVIKVGPGVGLMIAPLGTAQTVTLASPDLRRELRRFFDAICGKSQQEP